MNKLNLLLLLIIPFAVNAQYNDPVVAKPLTGYGADGNHTVGVIAFANPAFAGKNIEIYHPTDMTAKVPTIFYSHAYGGNISSNISGMLNFVAKKGYAIVYVPYQTTGVTVNDRYNNLLQGFRLAARNYPNIIDTTRVGFMGHSFGGGASFGLAYACITENNWGKDGRFIYALAQWYSYNITQDNLKNFPQDTKLLTEIFDDDTTNDHRMACDIFNTISIPATDKDFIRVKSDTINGYIHLADHVVPNTSSAFDALDYYAYYRFIDALCDYTFNHNPDGRDVALGHGNSAQITMPAGMKPLIETLTPQALYPQSKYLFQCDDIENLRKNYCSSTTDLETATENKAFSVIYLKNSATLEVFSPENGLFYLTNIEGKTICSVCLKERQKTAINISAFPAGIYLARCNNNVNRIIIF